MMVEQKFSVDDAKKVGVMLKYFRKVVGPMMEKNRFDAETNLETPLDANYH